ncbi:MAG: phage baseplate protein [Thermomicrobiales bacterium]
MRALSALDLLTVWECGLDQPPAHQALALLAVAWPDESPIALAELSIGERDARLLTLREWLFGPSLTSVAGCPTCGEQLELAFSVADIRAEPASDTARFQVRADGYVVDFRLPNSLDLLACAEAPDEDTARQALLTRCLTGSFHDGAATSGETLPAVVLDLMLDQMAAADPQADVQLALACPACGHTWQAAFDILTYLWSELHAWARRTLYDVHCLAAAYGWREADILALSPWRRQFYLGAVSQ